MKGYLPTRRLFRGSISANHLNSGRSRAKTQDFKELRNKNRAKTRGIIRQRLHSAFSLLVLVLIAASQSAILAYQYPNQGAAWTVAGSQASKNTPSGLKMRVTIGGAPNTFGLLNDTTLLMQNNTTVPLLPSAANGVQVVTLLNGCQASAPSSLSCSGLGTATIDFLDAANNPVKVKNPRLHISRIGGNVTTTTLGNVYFGVSLGLTTSGLTMNAPAAGSNNLAVSSNTISLANTSSAITGLCSATGAATAGCGTIPFTGTTSQLAFNIGATRNTTAVAWNVGTATTPVLNSQDGWFISVTFDEDFSDAPSSFNGVQAPSHIVSDLALGSSIDADNTTTLSSTTSPSAVAAGTNNNGTNGDGADEDAINNFPALFTSSTSYSLNVPISGASRAGQVCGWIDFNINNTFDAGERACTAFASGATSGTLSWSGLSGIVAGNRYVRLRAGYNTTQVQSPTGLADSGEVEDYLLTPDLTLAKSHTSNFAVGSTGTYSLTVTNSGTGVTSGTTTFSDTLPTGLTVNSGTAGAVTLGGADAANWTCNSNALTPQTISCTSTTAISNTSGSNTSVFSFNVNVGLGTAVGTNSITNTASVSGGGEIAGSTGNNSASDPTTVLSPDLTIAKSHTGNFTRGSTGNYTLTVSNAGSVSTSGTITVLDNLPIGLSVNGGAVGSVALSGADAANWTCNSDGASPQIITCTSTTTIAIAGTSVFNFDVNVSLSAAASVTNTASVSGGGEATANATNNSASDPTNVISITSGVPSVGLIKSCFLPADCTLAPQLPGTDLAYKIDFANTGGIGASSLIIVDRVPDNTDFKVGSSAANAATTGLTITIEYSNDYDPLNSGAATWTYTPISGGGGADAGYDRDVKAVRWRVTSGSLSQIAPNNAGDVSFITKIR